MFKTGEKPSRLKPPEQAELVRKLIVNTGSPMALPRSECEGWRRGLSLEDEGRVALYTGCLYQVMAYSKPALKLLELAEGSEAARRLISAASKLGAPLASRLLKLTGGNREKYWKALRGIAKALKASEVTFTTVDGDPYSGILLYELGYDGEFHRIAERLHRLLKGKGVEEVITVDPHTAEALIHAAPSTVEGWSIRTKHYIEVLAEKMPPVEYPERLEVVVHDPCILSRVLGLHEALRRVMEKISGLKYLEPKRSRLKTFCCGGPSEFYKPSTARRIAEERIRELTSTGASTVLVACPVCLANLSRCTSGGVEVVDLGEILEEIF